MVKIGIKSHCIDYGTIIPEGAFSIASFKGCKGTPAALTVLSMEYKIDFGNDNGDGKVNVSKTRNSPGKKVSKSSPKFPHVTRLLALAHHLQDLINQGVVNNYADIARLSNLSRARLSQIMNLTLLAPQIQEEILCLKGKDFLVDVKEQILRAVLKSPVWEEQVNIWEQQKTFFYIEHSQLNRQQVLQHTRSNAYQLILLWIIAF